MPWSGGNYTKWNGAGGWAADAAANIGIEAGRHDTQDTDFQNGINNCLAKDGSNAATADLNLGSFKITAMASGTSSSDAITLGQAQAGIDTQSTTLSVNATRFSADATGPSWQLRKSRGAIVGTNTIVNSGDTLGTINFQGANGSGYDTAAQISAIVNGTPGATTDMPGALIFSTTPDTSATPTERMRIDKDGVISIGLTGTNPISGNDDGIVLGQNGAIEVQRTNAAIMFIGRGGNDGALIDFYRGVTLVGTISVAGGVVTYGAFSGTHWAQLQGQSQQQLSIGTVLETVGTLCEWPNEENKHLPKVKISDTPGSNAVYGVFGDWDGDWQATQDLYCISLGAFYCRVNAAVSVQIGDLLESNGDGTARVQADNVIRSSTIGKVTSTIKSHFQTDGSYCVPTVLYCG